jgi:preprotein translocase subunit SecE
MEEGEVAESNRRGKKAADEPLDDDLLVDEADDETLTDDELSQDELDEIEEVEVVPARARRARSASAGSAQSVKGAKGPKVAKITEEKVGSGSRIARFIREVVAELRKVNWPSRKELLTYASVVIVFVVIMMSIVGGLDYVFAWMVSHVFAGN